METTQGFRIKAIEQTIPVAFGTLVAHDNFGRCNLQMVRAHLSSAGLVPASNDIFLYLYLYIYPLDPPPQPLLIASSKTGLVFPTSPPNPLPCRAQHPHPKTAPDNSHQTSPNVALIRFLNFYCVESHQNPKKFMGPRKALIGPESTLAALQNSLNPKPSRGELCFGPWPDMILCLGKHHPTAST